MDTETLPFARFLERHAFQDDLHKKQRMADIAARHTMLPGHLQAKQCESENRHDNQGRRVE